MSAESVASFEPANLAVVDTTTAPWETFPLPQIHAVPNALLPITEPDTGEQGLKPIHRAGFTAPARTASRLEPWWGRSFTDGQGTRRSAGIRA